MNCRHLWMDPLRGDGIYDLLIDGRRFAAVIRPLRYAWSNT